MAATIQTPTIRFSGFYYPELLQDLIAWRRADVPELTDEDPHDPTIQHLRAAALVGHYSNSLLDHAAQETMLPTAQLRESVRAQLALIDYHLRQQTAATGDVVGQLAAPLPAPSGIAEGSLFSTEETTTDPEILFELLADVPIAATNVIGQAWEYDASGPAYTDRTANLNTDGDHFALLAGAPAAGDLLYLGHAQIEWDRLDLKFVSAVTIPATSEICVEYHDASVDDANPTSVEMVGSVIRVHINSLLSSTDRHGASVRVRSAITGGYETAISTFAAGDNRVDLATHLGQTIPSVDPSDYVVGVEWKEVSDLVLSKSTDQLTLQAAFTLPESALRKWTTTTINAVTAFWLRIRFVNPLAVAWPDLDRAKIDQGTQYIRLNVTQGQSTSDDPSGSSDGTPGQTFVTAIADVIDSTVVALIDDGAGFVAWTAVRDFLESTAISKHFIVDFDADGYAIVTFGDGVNGTIPPIGSDIRIDYRYGAVDDGNVGPSTVAINKSGVSLLAAVANPRAMAGWKVPEGSTPADLALAKIAGPASLRTRDRALTAQDCEDLAVKFVDAAGASPVARAKCVEEAYGPKTIQLLVIGAGGNSVSTDVLTEVDAYFNDDPVTGVAGVLLLNSQLTAKNFTLKTIDVTATVKGGDKTAIETALRAFLQPLAVDPIDGAYVHTPGAYLYRERISAEIFAADPGKVKNVTWTLPAADVLLAADELPTPGTILITIV